MRPEYRKDTRVDKQRYLTKQRDRRRFRVRKPIRGSTERPRFTPFALIAAMLWSTALLLRLTVPAFAVFP